MIEPPNPAAHASPDTGFDFGGGANQVGARAYNDRLVLSLIRRAGALPKAELARITGLSPQTLTLIVKRLEAENLLTPTAPIRGLKGQPSVPYRLNPDAVLSFGLKIGRRSAELMLCDFCGEVRARLEERYAYPMPEAVLRFFASGTAQMRDALDTPQRQRLIGAGIAMPFELWSWSEPLDAPEGALEDWRDFPVEAMASEALGGRKVVVWNDATSACAAELLRTGPPPSGNFLYLFVGWFVGGGIVLDGTLYPGRTGNAGALGSMLVRGEDGMVPLLQRASLMRLESLTGTEIANADACWQVDADALDRWIREAAGAIAEAAVNAAAVIDFEALRIDGALPAEIRTRLVAATRDAYALLDTRGLSPLRLEEGSVGRDARTIGAAMLPVLLNFSRDSDVLLKQVSI